MLIAFFCLLSVGCGGGNGPVVIQQPAPPVTGVTPTPTTTTVLPTPTTPTTPTTVPVTPVPTTTATTTITLPTPPTTTIIIVQPPPFATPPPPPTAFPPPPTLPPFDPNRPPWWARPRGGRGGTITIIKIKPGEIDIITRRRGGWDGWRRGPNGWFNPNSGEWIQPGTQGVPPTIPTTDETIPFDTNTVTQTIVVPPPK